jgi:predicted nuclease of restriction endonuclease-like RecB superfamily
VRFSLQDVKRQVRRRDGILTVTLHFLRSGELSAEIARLIALLEQQCGQRRKDFAREEASALVGDYRLASCLLITLGAWYIWRQPAWEEALNDVSEEAQTALVEAAIASPVSLRLALFDYVHTYHAGFLHTQTRQPALVAFASLYGLTVPRLEYLLALDSDDEAVLTRIADMPRVDVVAATYNQWAFEAALCTASEVRFLIDCDAFLQAQQSTMADPRTGPGAVIKRLCYLARRLGVYYDLAYEDPPSGVHTTRLRLTLYGPQEVTGRAQQYGQRLARLCRLLLDYGTACSPQRRARRQDAVILGKALRQAEATVHLFQQPYRFSLDEALLALMPATEQENAEQIPDMAPALYDSSIEQSFAQAFTALARLHSTDGWQLEREPEPLLLSWERERTRGIFIPDFVLWRGTRRIYVEILGFWTPAYRERKLQKLQQLKGQVDLILALPVEAHQAFASLASDYPLIEYRDQLSVMPLLQTLQQHYDDFEERLASLEIAPVRARVHAEGLIAEDACYQFLHCYRRSELARAAERVLEPGIIVYTPGVGLYLTSRLEHLHRSLVEWIEAQGQSAWSLPAMLQECKNIWPQLAGCADAAIEILLSSWPQVQIRRASLFEATVTVQGVHGVEQAPAPQALTSPGARTVVRERRPGRKKSRQQEAGQQNLWDPESNVSTGSLSEERTP